MRTETQNQDKSTYISYGRKFESRKLLFAFATIVSPPANQSTTQVSRIKHMMDSFAAGMKEFMKNDMEKERGKLEKRIAELERLAKADAGPITSSSSSWTSSYTKFNHLDDDTKEEMEEQISLARSKLNSLNAKMQSNQNACPRPCLCCSQDRSAEIAVIKMSTQERIEVMKELKLEGNSLFKNNSNHEALGKYELALIYYEYCYDAAGNDRIELENVRLLCLLNAAACTLNLKSYAQCTEFCNEALEIDDANPKAFYRRGKAYRLLNQYDNAKRDMKKAVELTRGGIECNREMKLLQQCKEQYKQDTLNFAQRAIGGSKTDKTN